MFPILSFILRLLFLPLFLSGVLYFFYVFYLSICLVFALSRSSPSLVCNNSVLCPWVAGPSFPVVRLLLHCGCNKIQSSVTQCTCTTHPSLSTSTSDSAAATGLFLTCVSNNTFQCIPLPWQSVNNWCVYAAESQMHKLLLDISVDAFSGHALHFLTIFGQFFFLKLWRRITTYKRTIIGYTVN